MCVYVCVCICVCMCVYMLCVYVYKSIQGIKNVTNNGKVGVLYLEQVTLSTHLSSSNEDGADDIGCVGVEPSNGTSHG